MVQKTYSAYSDDLTNQHLFIELGYNHLACWCKRNNEKKFSAFEFFQCDNYDASVFDTVVSEAKLHSKLLVIDVIDTTVLWNSAENLAVPSAFANNNFLYDNFCLINGFNDNGKLYQSQFEDVLLVTRVDAHLNNAAQKVFPNAIFDNGFKLDKPAEENAVYIFFYPHCFFCAAYKNEKLQFIQTKLFTEPADVLYFILNIFHQYKFEKNVPVIAGGFINADSKLFETLYQYLEGFALGNIEETFFASPEFKAYPSHYFLPYINYMI